MPLRRRPLSALTTFGLVALAIANIAQYSLQRHTEWPESVTDPVGGFLFGVAIAATLLGISKQSRTLEKGC